MGRRAADPTGSLLPFLLAVIYICGPLEMLHQVMRRAQSEGMTNGDYVFFYVDVFAESLQGDGHQGAAKPWQSKEGQDSGTLREAFQVSLVAGERSLHPWTPKRGEG